MSRALRLTVAIQLLSAATIVAQQTTPFTVGSATAAPGTTAYGSIAIPSRVGLSPPDRGRGHSRSEAGTRCRIRCRQSRD